MRSLDLSKLRLFYIVAQEGNLTRAANRLNISQPALSKALADFEDRLNVKVFYRVRHGMELTPQGERLYVYAKKVIQENEAFVRQFYDDQEIIEGDLKIITYPFIGAEWLLPNLKGFIKAFPEVDIKIRLESESPNLTEADVIIAAYIPNQPHLIQKPLFSARTHLFASKEYLKKYGIPQTPEDLDNHRLITYRGNYSSATRGIDIVIKTGMSAWEPPRKSSIEIDSLQGMINSALAGYGIAELPNYPAVLNSELKMVLPEIHGEDIIIYYIFMDNRKNSKKISKLYEFLIKEKKIP